MDLRSLCLTVNSTVCSTISQGISPLAHDCKVEHTAYVEVKKVKLHEENCGGLVAVGFCGSSG